MSFPRYPKYKASGVEWLGDVPEGWDVKRSDSFLSYSRAQLDPKDFQGLEVFHYSIPVVQETGTGQLEDGAEIASGKQVVKKKVVLVSKLNPRKGTICIAEPQQALTLCSTEFVALEPNGCDIRYLTYLVRTESFRQGLESKVTSVTNSHQRANPVDIYRFWNAWPALSEQTAIAEFLDRETGKIDELVAEQRRLMELLKEKRQAVISHAITKGLNPHAPMKPSGIEWLGDVPIGWEVKRLRFVANLNPSKSEISAFDRETTVSFLPMEAVGDDGTLVLDKEKTIAELETGYTYFRDGDVTIAKITPCYENGKGAIMRGLTNGIGFGTTELIVVRPMTLEITSAYLHYLFISPDFRGLGESHMYGAGGQKRVPDAFVRNFATGIPPLPEQIAIAEFLETELAKFDTLTAEAQRAIDLLQERRTALISAAVTGQIDVRQQTRN